MVIEIIKKLKNTWEARLIIWSFRRYFNASYCSILLSVTFLSPTVTFSGFSIDETSLITGDGINCLIHTRISFVGVIQAMCVGMDRLVSVSFGNDTNPFWVTVGQLTTIFALTKVETVVELFPYKKEDYYNFDLTCPE